jgi:hypothetical protein
MQAHRILPMSAMVMDKGGTAPPLAFHDTVLPSADTDTVPSCFLYEAAAVDMVGEVGSCCGTTIAAAHA